jgi:hypothetical protein
MWDMYTFVHKYIIPSSKPFEFLKTSLGTRTLQENKSLTSDPTTF